MSALAFACHHETPEKAEPIASIDAAVSAAAPAVDAAPEVVLPPPPTPAALPEWKKLSPDERDKTLAAITTLKGFIARREKRGRETDDDCQAKNTIERPHVEAAMTQIGEPGMSGPTRFSKDDPEATLESFIGGCIMCTSLDFPGPAFPPECPKATTALDDLARRVKAN